MPTPGTLPTRLWSYALLDRCKVLVPVDAAGREDLLRIGSLWLEHYSAEHGEGHVMMSGPSKEEIARWLFGLLAIAPGYLKARAGQTKKVERVFTSFVEVDRLQRRSRAAALRPTPTTPEGRIAARRERQQLANETQRHHQRLRAALRTGLQRRVGGLLEGEEKVWLALVARRYEALGLRVCEQCSIVFETRRRRTRRCRACHRSPVVPKLHPVATGGWHVEFRVGERWSSGEFEPTVTYMAICRRCGRRFDTTHPSRRLCLNCGSTSGRVRRHRGSRSSTGRASVAYASTDEHPLLSVTVTGPDGEGIVLHAEYGVVRVSDLEYVRQLDANPHVRRAST
jgi:hypothetical protein